PLLHADERRAGDCGRVLAAVHRRVHLERALADRGVEDAVGAVSVLDGVGAAGERKVPVVTYPTPYTVGYHVRNPDGPDPFREAPSYTPPKGEAGIPVPVIQWEAAVSNT